MRERLEITSLICDGLLRKMFFWTRKKSNLFHFPLKHIWGRKLRNLRTLPGTKIKPRFFREIRKKRMQKRNKWAKKQTNKQLRINQIWLCFKIDRICMHHYIFHLVYSLSYFDYNLFLGFFIDFLLFLFIF